MRSKLTNSIFKDELTALYVQKDLRYREGSLQLMPGDRIFLYTDGVTEATDGAGRLYGSERLHRVLNANLDAGPETLLPTVKADVDQFVGDAPQFDDITMLCMEYRGQTQG